LIRLVAPEIGAEEVDAVVAVLRSGNLVQGPEVEAFEHEFASLVGGRHCVAVNSGTSALHLALVAAGLGPGDEVIVPSFTFAGTANAVRLAGATPVFADIEPDHFCLDPDAAAAAVGDRTAAILPVHLFGHPAAMDRLSALAARHQLLLAEDACQAHGASLGGSEVGTFGSGSSFSFYATKNMTTGEGGMVVTPDASTARTVRLLRNQGMERTYENELVGFNMRLTDVAAAMGRVQLRRLPALNERRRAHAAMLDDALRGHVVVPAVAPGAVHVYHQYTIRVEERDKVQARLKEAGVGSAVYYPVPVHRLPPYVTGADIHGPDLPETERAARNVLSLPVGPHLGEDDVRTVARSVLEAVSR